MKKLFEQLNRIMSKWQVTNTCHSEHPPGAWESSWLYRFLVKAYPTKYIRSAGSPRRSAPRDDMHLLVRHLQDDGFPHVCHAERSEGSQEPHVRHPELVSGSHKSFHVIPSVPQDAWESSRSENVMFSALQIFGFGFRTISFGAKETVPKENMCVYFVPKYTMHDFLQTFGLYWLKRLQLSNRRVVCLC